MAVAEGKDPQADKRAERGAGTFADLAARYVEQYAKRKNKSWAQADRLVRRYVLPRWGKLQAAGIVRADVKALMASIVNAARIERREWVYGDHYLRGALSATIGHGLRSRGSFLARSTALGRKNCCRFKS